MQGSPWRAATRNRHEIFAVPWEMDEKALVQKAPGSETIFAAIFALLFFFLMTVLGVYNNFNGLK